MTQLFLGCDDCGEVFDTIETARNHETPEHEEFPSYTILTEAEAF